MRPTLADLDALLLRPLPHIRRVSTVTCGTNCTGGRGRLAGSLRPLEPPKVYKAVPPGARPRWADPYGLTTPAASLRCRGLILASPGRQTSTTAAECCATSWLVSTRHAGQGSVRIFLRIRRLGVRVPPSAPLRGVGPGVSARLGLDEARRAHAGPHGHPWAGRQPLPSAQRSPYRWGQNL